MSRYLGFFGLQEESAGRLQSAGVDTSFTPLLTDCSLFMSLVNVNNLFVHVVIIIIIYGSPFLPGKHE